MTIAERIHERLTIIDTAIFAALSATPDGSMMRPKLVAETAKRLWRRTKGRSLDDLHLTAFERILELQREGKLINRNKRMSRACELN